MKEILLQYAAYNLWANKRIIDVMIALPEDELDKDIVSSFRSIRKTVYHTWSAEDIWLQRLRLTEHPVWAEGVFTGTFREACKLWEDVSLQLKAFIEQQFDDKAFDHEMQYYNLRKMPSKHRVADVLLHLFNHSTYHRGQLVTMLRQSGVQTIPATDLIAFVRK